MSTYFEVLPVGSSETHCHQAPGVRTAVVEAPSCRWIVPQHTRRWARKFHKEIRSTERARSQILKSAEECRVRSFERPASSAGRMCGSSRDAILQRVNPAAHALLSAQVPPRFARKVCQKDFILTAGTIALGNAVFRVQRLPRDFGGDNCSSAAARASFASHVLLRSGRRILGAFICIYISVSLSLYVCISIYLLYIYTYMYRHMYIYDIYMNIYINIHINIDIYMHVNRQSGSNE
jgi:hypothetical protein